MTPDAAGPVEAVLARAMWESTALGRDLPWEDAPLEASGVLWETAAHVAAALAPMFAAHGAAERRAGAVEFADEVDKRISESAAALDPYVVVDTPPHVAGLLEARGYVREARAAALGDRADGMGKALAEAQDRAAVRDGHAGKDWPCDFPTPHPPHEASAYDDLGILTGYTEHCHGGLGDRADEAVER